MDDMLDMHASFSRTSRYQIYSDLNRRFFNNTIPDTQQHLEMFEEKEIESKTLGMGLCVYNIVERESLLLRNVSLPLKGCLC